MELEVLETPLLFIECTIKIDFVETAHVCQCTSQVTTLRYRVKFFIEM